MTQTTPFHLRICDEGRQVRLSVTGDVDLHSEAGLLNAAETAVASLDQPDGWRDTLVLDLSGVSFMDSSGLRAVLRCQRITAEVGASLRVVVAGGPVARLFDVAGVAGRFDYD